MVDLILFPASYFSAEKVDEDFEEEYEAVLATGLFDVYLYRDERGCFILHQGLIDPDRKSTNMRRAVMRGWMMKPEQYREFYEMLKENYIELITTPTEYEQMHIFPNVYKFFGEDTALMKTYPLHEQIDVEELKKCFDRFMIKDYVKSVKGTEFPRYFDASISQEKFDVWMGIFYKYRGDLLTGGICVKEFLDLKIYGKYSNEYRVFYVRNEVLCISRNSGQPNYTAEPPMELIEKYKNLPSCYYTVDFAEFADGAWKVIEAGDGSVSGLTEKQVPEQYYRALFYALFDRSEYLEKANVYGKKCNKKDDYSFGSII